MRRIYKASKAKPKKRAVVQPDLEGMLLEQLLEAGLADGIKRQYKFHPRRRWKVDFYYPDHRLIIEVEGGAFVGGRHVRGKGYEKDCEKYNAITLAGYRLLRYTGGMIRRRKAIPEIAQALGRL